MTEKRHVLVLCKLTRILSVSMRVHRVSHTSSADGCDTVTLLLETLVDHE